MKCKLLWHSVTNFSVTNILEHIISVVKHTTEILQYFSSEWHQTTSNKDESNPNCIQRVSCYIVVNTFSLHYKNKPVGAVEGNDCSLSQELYQIRK